MNINNLHMILQDALDTLRYDFLGLAKPSVDLKALLNIPRKLVFNTVPDEGGYVIEAKNLPGFVLFIKDVNSAADTISEALFAYYDIPRYYARKLSTSAIVTNKANEVISETTPKGGSELLNYVRI